MIRCSNSIQLSAKLWYCENHFNLRSLAHWCPACGELHYIMVTKPHYGLGSSWEWNRDPDRPTIWPFMNLLWRISGVEFRCHYEIVEGWIHYAHDCTHVSAGAVVELPDIPGWYLGNGPPA